MKLSARVRARRALLAGGAAVGAALIVVLAAGQLSGAAGPWDAAPEVFEQNRLAATARTVPQADVDAAIAADDAGSPWLISLNGSWRFDWSPSLDEAPGSFMDPQVSVAAWDTVDVPHQWQLDGYGDAATGDLVYLNEAHPWQGEQEISPPAIPTAGASIGSYRRDIEVPREWDGRRTVLAFQGVKSAFTVWVNGVEVGYSEDSYTPAEFDVTAALVPGRNTVAVQVHRWSDGSWLENQDQIDLSGIFRDVELYSTPTTYLDDHTVTTSVDADGSATVQLATRVAGVSPDDARLRATLYGPDGEPVTTADVDGGVGTASMEVPDALLWNAETPHLYSVVYELEVGGTPVEVVGARVGIREIAIVDGLMTLNGAPLDIKGINRGEMHPDVGQAMTESIMRSDLEAMKAANITAVRTSHYPAHPMLYRLADEIGLYVMDEANVETHELRPFPGNSPEWSAAVLDRVTSMYERDKNHASVLWWSLGNEAGPGAVFHAAADWLRAADPGRIVHYQDDPSVADIEGVFYPSLTAVRERAEVTMGRPWIMTEYAMAMGNSVGGIAEYWEAIDSSPEMQGGFVWDWADQAIRLPLEGGVDALPVGDLDDDETYLSYGGDWGDGPTDGGFSLNGLVNPDRVPQPELQAVADAYVPVEIDGAGAAAGQVSVCNEYLVTDLAELEAIWERAVDGVVTDSGTLDWALVPGTCADLPVPTAATLPAQAGDEHTTTLSITVALAEPTAWAGAGHPVAHEQIVLADAPVPQGVEDVSGLTLSVTPGNGSVRIHGERVDAVVDADTGLMRELRLAGVDILHEGAGQTDGAGPGLALDFWRATTQNDLMNGLASSAHTWRDAADVDPHDVEIAQVDRSTVRVAVTYELNVAGRPSAQLITTLRAAGHMQVDAMLESSPDPREIPAMGVALTMPSELDALTWWGDGPHSTWIDRTGGAHLGRWTSTVDDQLFPHVVPQAEGNHTNVRWMALGDDEGAGAVITALGSPVEAAALPASDAAIEQARHQHEVVRGEAVHLAVDAIQAGVGQSWGETPLPGFSVGTDQTWHLSFLLSPLSAGVDPMAAARQGLALE